MPRVITLKDGRCETLFSNRDFEYLIKKYMGCESVQFFRDALAEKDEEMEELRETLEGKLDTLQDMYDELLDKMEEEAHDE